MIPSRRCDSVTESSVIPSRGFVIPSRYVTENSEGKNSSFCSNSSSGILKCRKQHKKNFIWLKLERYHTFLHSLKLAKLINFHECDGITIETCRDGHHISVFGVSWKVCFTWYSSLVFTQHHALILLPSQESGLLRLYWFSFKRRCDGITHGDGRHCVIPSHHLQKLFVTQLFKIASRECFHHPRLYLLLLRKKRDLSWSLVSVANPPCDGITFSMWFRHVAKSSLLKPTFHPGTFQK